MHRSQCCASVSGVLMNIFSAHPIEQLAAGMPHEQLQNSCDEADSWLVDQLGTSPKNAFRGSHQMHPATFKHAPLQILAASGMTTLSPALHLLQLLRWEPCVMRNRPQYLSTSSITGM